MSYWRVSARITPNESEIEIPTALSAWFLSYFFQRSLGCIGMLRDWLVQATNRSKSAGSWVVTREHLDAAALKSEQLSYILTEIEQGENRWGNSPAALKTLQKKLTVNFVKKKGQKAEPPKVEIPPKEQNGAEDSNGNSKKKLFPGESAPKRLDIGDRPPGGESRPS